MTDIKSAEDIKPGSVPALARGQKSGLDLTLYGGRVLPQTFGQVVEFAQMMCKGGVAIPKHLRENPGACLSVIQRSMAWEMDPWAVATKTYAVNDILAYEAQLIAAVVKKWAPIREKVIPYKFEGEGMDMSCSILLHHIETGEEIYYQSPKIRDIEPRNSPLWKTEKQQQLSYYSIRALARRHFAEILLGVYDREEAYAMKDITPQEPTPNYLVEDETELPRRAPESAASEVDGEAGRESPADSTIKVTPLQERVVVSVGGKTVTRNGEPIEAGDLKVGETYEFDRNTGEILDGVREDDPPEEVITPEKMAENMVKAINGFTSKVHLEDWQNESNADINALPKPLYKVVKKALDDKHLDLLPL